jgi:small nuclear ribonucleoprotein D3
MANLGVPVKLLHESVGHVVTVELKTGQVSSEIRL